MKESDSFLRLETLNLALFRREIAGAVRRYPLS